MGFDAVPNWRRQLIASVLSNFFFAILDEKLIVEVEGAEQEGLPSQISKHTIASAFETLSSDPTLDESIIDSKSLFETIALTDGETSIVRDFTSDGQLQYLGRTKIWIHVSEGLPNSVLIVRDPGMAICDAVRRFRYLKHLPSYWGNFAAVVVCADQDGNELLRSMEPPAHDGFEPDRLKGFGNDSLATKGQRALDELGQRIRRWIDLQMPKLDDDQVARLDELSDYFPSEGLDTDSNPIGEESDPFGNAIVGETATKLPVVRKITLPTIDEDQDVEDADAEGEEQRYSEQSSNRGTGNGNPNQNIGPGNPAKGPKGTISGLRMSREDRRFFVSFTPDESFVGRISIAVASEEKRFEDTVEITGLIDQFGRATKSNIVELEGGQRVRYEVLTEPPLPDGHAINVEATKEVVP